MPDNSNDNDPPACFIGVADQGLFIKGQKCDQVRDFSHIQSMINFQAPEEGQSACGWVDGVPSRLTTVLVALTALEQIQTDLPLSALDID